VADHLVPGQRSPERLALLRVGDRLLENDAHGPDRPECHRQPLPLEVGHDQVEALVLLAEQVLLGHEDVGEGELAGVDARQPILSSLRDTE